MNMGWIYFAVVAVVLLLAVTLYNRLVSLRMTRKNAFSDIDVQLHQRYDLVPRLVETVKGYASHEKELFEKVTAARAAVGNTQGTGADRVAAENRLSGALANLYAVAENYPELKADASFRQLMAELTDIENKIAAARRFFNNATGEYNTAIQQFPANLFAASFGFREEVFFELPENDAAAMRSAPEVKF